MCVLGVALSACPASAGLSSFARIEETAALSTGPGSISSPTSFHLMDPEHLAQLIRDRGLVEAAETPSRALSLGPRPLDQRLVAPTWRFAGTFSAGVVAGGYALWWRRRSLTAFEHASEGWFGEGTYAGGADKSNHFVVGYIGGRFLQERLEMLGHRKGTARTLSVAMTALGGLLVEVGDAFSEYAFSWEDAVATSAGSAAGALIDAANLGDTLGLRFGRVPTRIPAEMWTPESSTSYHHTIDALDVHLSGLLPRLGVNPGPARFLLLSGTYASRGYGFAPPSGRQRLVGLELGLDVPEILRAAGVREDTWWGGPLLFFTRFFRVPYTAIGWRYDLNGSRWIGPDAGDLYSP